jgi:ACS family hexuronate transporter-like MFS transporter
MTDPIWWFYLYWLPKFLNERHHLDLSSIAAPLVAIYTISSFGSIAGGWLSGYLIRTGLSVDRSRKTVFLICALCVVPIVDAAHVTSLWAAVLLIGLAAAAHQGWSANLFTTASDIFPHADVASMTGIGGMAGSVGGMLFAGGAGWLLQVTNGSYGWLFLISGCAYLAALGFFCILVPRIEPVAQLPARSET